MIQLQRITTEYVEAEDRIRLSGEVDGGETIALWLTQRLLSHVISHLIILVEQQTPSLGNDAKASVPTSSLLQGFAQQAAESELPSEPPVEVEAISEVYLVQEIDISPTSEGLLVLVFKRELGSAKQPGEAKKAALSLGVKQLRQWLGIVHIQWQKAGWPLALWPSWMDEQSPSDTHNPLH